MGELIRVPTQGWMVAVCGAPLCFGTLAYLNQVEEREKFILAIRSSQAVGSHEAAGHPATSLPSESLSQKCAKGKPKTHGIWDESVSIIECKWDRLLGCVRRRWQSVFRYSEPTSNRKLGLELHGVAPSLMGGYWRY